MNLSHFRRKVRVGKDSARLLEGASAAELFHAQIPIAIAISMNLVELLMTDLTP